MFLHSVSVCEVHVRTKTFFGSFKLFTRNVQLYKKEDTPLYGQCYEKWDLSVVASAVLRYFIVCEYCACDKD